MGEAALRRITVDEFLAWEGEGKQRYELIRGEIFAMAPPANAHFLIVANTISAIRQKVTPPCKVLGEVGIQLSARDDTFYQADIAVVCSPIQPRAHGVRDPVLIAEILSPSTMTKDSGIKVTDYRRVWSVKEIVLIHSEDKRVELFRRGAESWTVIDLEAGDVIKLESLGFDIPVEALYDGLDFTPSAAAESR
jgi:Uma2 family endonuclease